MRNHPSPRDNRSCPSNFGEISEVCFPQPAGVAGEGSPLPPELRRVDQEGRDELDVRGPREARLGLQISDTGGAFQPPSNQ